MVQNLGHARLLGNDHRDSGPHGLQRRNPERLRNRRHHIHIAHRVHPVHIHSFEETGEMETATQAQGCHLAHNLMQHIARPGHHELHILVLFHH